MPSLDVPALQRIKELGGSASATLGASGGLPVPQIVFEIPGVQVVE